MTINNFFTVLLTLSFIPCCAADNKHVLSEQLLDAAGGLNIGRIVTLLDKGADVNARTKIIQSTPLMLASKAGHPKVVKILLQRGADVHAKNSLGQTALELARIHKALALQKPRKNDYTLIINELEKAGK